MNVNDSYTHEQFLKDARQASHTLGLSRSKAKECGAIFLGFANAHDAETFLQRRAAAAASAAPHTTTQPVNLTPAQQATLLADHLEAEWDEFNRSGFRDEDADWIARMQERYGFHGEHERFPRSDWRYEAANDDTQLGYWDWLTHQLTFYFYDIQTS